MIECFHLSLKSSPRACLAGQDWVKHLPSVLLGFRTTPKEDSGYAPAEALFGTQLAVPGEFLDAPDLPLTDFLQNIYFTITGFSGPVPHHTCPAPAKPLPKTLLSSEFVFVHEDSSFPAFSQLYRGPYKVLGRKDKYFKLQIGSKQDNVSVDRLKPVFSNKKVSPALPPPRGRPPRRPLPPAENPPPPAANPPPPVRITNKSVRFSLPSCRNPPQAALLPRRFYQRPFWGE